MYVCMYVCVYYTCVYIYICMYIYIYIHIYIYTHMYIHLIIPIEYYIYMFHFVSLLLLLLLLYIHARAQLISPRFEFILSIIVAMNIGLQQLITYMIRVVITCVIVNASIVTISIRMLCCRLPSRASSSP